MVLRVIREAFRILWFRYFHVCSEWDRHGRCVICLEPIPRVERSEMAAWDPGDPPMRRDTDV